MSKGGRLIAELAWLSKCRGWVALFLKGTAVVHIIDAFERGTDEKWNSWHERIAGWLRGSFSFAPMTTSSLCVVWLLAGGFELCFWWETLASFYWIILWTSHQMNSNMPIILRITNCCALALFTCSRAEYQLRRKNSMSRQIFHSSRHQRRINQQITNWSPPGICIFLSLSGRNLRESVGASNFH